MSPKIDYIAQLKGSLKLSKNGEWWHEGQPFKNIELARFFLKSIIWDEATACYYIQVGNQRATFDLEDTPYFVEALIDDLTPWQIRLSDQTDEPLMLDTLTSGSEGQLYCNVKDGKHKARFSRAAHQRVMTHALDESRIEVAGNPYEIKKLL